MKGRKLELPTTQFSVSVDLKVLLARPFKPVKAVFRASWNELTDDEFTYVVYLWEPRHKS